MKTIQYNVKCPEVIILCELLNRIGFQLTVTDSFTMVVDAAVKEFQLKNNLVVDGIVGVKTWSKLYELQPNLTVHNDKFLCEQDLIDFSNLYNVDLAAIKAVNQVESSGKGFLVSGKPKILFEGHVFWKELEKRGVNPVSLVSGNEDVLYKSWTKSFYQGGEGEHDRLQKAISIIPGSIGPEPALAAASWGCFQIMGNNATHIGYNSVTEFVDKMYLSEREHLIALGRFLESHSANLIALLKDKNWDKFAYYYNGSNYKANKYDEKLAIAYRKYL
ncbi:N-acetylmuramidase family protein [Flavobacterium amniphilum]|uniref:N-acetylmuramidase domain-containing protein n=1 Tax=Flavobacterium amniphilum TaxID=1834035 RepID=UPI00202A4F15|nr:N-acetylmuramidase family protein [Flavobacterium amniphilum]MCL9805058.1 N-acetylmuramidase family protein [Flavobacterium amniphilum]